MKRKYAVIILVLALIVAYIYLNRKVCEGMEEKVPQPSKVPIGPRKVPVEPIAPE